MNPFSSTDYYNRQVRPSFFWLGVSFLLLTLQGYVLFNDAAPSQPADWLRALVKILTPLPGATAPGETGFDLIVHFSSFALITMTLLLARFRPLFIILVFGSYAAASEIIQEFMLYYRTGSFADLTADWLGITFSLLIFLYWYQRKI